MEFQETVIAGVLVVQTEKAQDPRGYFVRTFCTKEFRARGIAFSPLQTSLSMNLKSGTLRGMHYQTAPYEEDKLVSCVSGALFDVALDLRPLSPTYRQWTGIELNADNGKMLFIPKGVAHGFQTLVDRTLIHYQIGQDYHPEFGRGVRWDDPAFQIQWPLTKERIISDRDRNYPLFRAE